MIYSHLGLHNSVSASLKELGNMSKRLMELNAIAHCCGAVFQTLDDIHHTISTNAYWGQKLMIVSCQVDSMDDITRILREFGTIQFSQTTEVEENPGNQTRTYRLGRAGSAEIRLDIALKGTVCKYVEIGKKTVEEPVYELRCEDPEEKKEAA